MAVRLTTESRRLDDERTAYWNQGADFREQWTQLFANWRIKINRSAADNPGNDFRSQIRVPRDFQAVEVLVPRIVGKEPQMGWRAEDYSEDAPTAYVQSKLARQQSARMGLKLQLKRFVRQGLIANYTLAKVGWVRDVRDVSYTEIVQRVEPLAGGLMQVEEERTERAVVKDGPFVDVVSVFDFAWPVAARTLDEADAVWQRRLVTMKHLRELAAAGIYDAKVVAETKPAARLMTEAQREQFEQQGVNVPGEFRDDDDELAQVELWERWTDGELIVVVNPQEGGAIIRKDPNPFTHGRKPFIDWSPIPDVLQMPGVSIMQVVHDLVEDLTTMRRQRSDAMSYVVNPAFKGRGYPAGKLKLFPGAFFPTDDLKQLEPMFMPTVDFGSQERLEERIIRDIEDMTGASSTLSGQSNAGTTTATGVTTLNTEAHERIGEMVDELNQRAMMRLGFLWASMNAQFLDSSQVGVDFSMDPAGAQAWDTMHRLSSMQTPDVPIGQVLVSGEWLRSRGRLVPIPEVGFERDQDKIQKRSDAAQLVAALAPFAQMQPIPYSVKGLVEQVLKSFDVSLDDRRRILDNSEEMQAFMAAQQQAAAQQAQEQAMQQEQAATDQQNQQDQYAREDQQRSQDQAFKADQAERDRQHQLAVEKQRNDNRKAGGVPGSPGASG